MKEVEIKILEVNRKKIECKLISLGAKKIFDNEMYSIYYDFDNKFLHKEKAVLRIRKEGNASFLELKEFIPAKRAKIRKESRVKISDFETMGIILKLLGLKPWRIMKKHRTSYELNGVHFDFDKYKENYEFVPEFLEIESENEEIVYKYAEILGFKKEECKNWGFMKVINYYSK